MERELEPIQVSPSAVDVVQEVLPTVQNSSASSLMT